VIVSAYGDMANIRTAMNRGAFDFVTKPVDLADLEVTIDKTLESIAHVRGLDRQRAAARVLVCVAVAEQQPWQRRVNVLVDDARRAGGAAVSAHNATAHVGQRWRRGVSELGTVVYGHDKDGQRVRAAEAAGVRQRHVDSSELAAAATRA
jgi:YesN/AraC family two-component response regulator